MRSPGRNQFSNRRSVHAKFRHGGNSGFVLVGIVLRLTIYVVRIRNVYRENVNVSGFKRYLVTNVRVLDVNNSSSDTIEFSRLPTEPTEMSSLASFSRKSALDWTNWKCHDNFLRRSVLSDISLRFNSCSANIIHETRRSPNVSTDLILRFNDSIYFVPFFYD